MAMTTENFEMDTSKSAETAESVVSTEIAEGVTPYVRLLHHGAACLSDAELVELLFSRGDGESRPTVVDMPPAATLLTEAGGVTGLLSADLPSLLFQGLPEPEAALLLAAAELARRQARAELPTEAMEDPAALARYLFLRFGNEEQEILGVLFLDMRGRLLGEAEVFRGSMTRAQAEPRTILRQALIRHAAQIVLFHNHPGGDPDPSRQDLELTHRMRKAGELMGVHLMDHLILGREGAWFSLVNFSGRQLKVLTETLEEFKHLLAGAAQSAAPEQASP